MIFIFIAQGHRNSAAVPSSLIRFLKEINANFKGDCLTSKLSTKSDYHY